jgi:hypothetical protein
MEKQALIQEVDRSYRSIQSQDLCGVADSSPVLRVLWEFNVSD